MTEKKHPETISDVIPETREYINLRIDEAKLKVTKGLSIALSRTLAYLLIIAVLAIALGILSYALLQWLNGLVGAPWGTLIIGGLLLVVLVVLWIKRNSLFTNLFVKVFIDAFYGDGEGSGNE